MALHLNRIHTHHIFLDSVIRVDNACQQYRLVYGMWGRFQQGKLLVSGGPDMLVCHSEVTVSYLGVLWEVIAHQAGCEDWTCGEETCVYDLAPGINYGNKSGPEKELYQGVECAHVIHAVCEHVCLEGSVGQIGCCGQYLVASCW